MLSVLIPARNELFLPQTVEDIFDKATGQIEVIVNLDGYWPEPILPDRPNLVIIHRSQAGGMRQAINSMASIAKGEWFLKCDAHCMFAEGFDEVLAAECDQDWIMIPARYSLDAENWCINPKRGRIDYHYLCCPDTNKDGYSFHGQIWRERRREREQYEIDDEMTFQGSCWFMARRHFWDFLGGMQEEGYGTFSQEPQEIGLKTWLGGGQIKVNKKTWYAHLHKGKKYGRMYFMSKREVIAGHEYSAKYWMGNQWAERVHDIEWLIDKFWPVPTWPEEWIIKAREQGFK